MIGKVLLTCLCMSLFSFSCFAGNKLINSLTAEEWQLLKNREKNQITRIINSTEPKELQLLKSMSREVSFKSPHIKKLIHQMRQAVSAAHGLGLAAVQIGIPVRVVLLQQKIEGEQVFKVFINPKVLHKSTVMQITYESCLSVGGKETHIMQRSSRVTVSFQNIHGKSVTENLTGLDAAIFQQEIDHLNGILLEDYPPLVVQ